MQKEPNSYITIQPNSHYHNAAYNAGLCKSNQYLVIDFEAWVKWYNDARFQRNPIVPTPTFSGDTYEVALKVRDELNQSADSVLAITEKDSK
jgi:hypothetical protein